MTTAVRRYAIYFAPAPDSPLGAFGSRWLGRDPWTGEALPQPEVPGITPDRLHAITASPRFYGFHGTLKPPFVLAEGTTADDLDAAAHAFARERSPFEVPLALRSLSSFFALVPAEPVPALDALAAGCVRAFDRFRAPPDEAELSRRRAAGLTPRQDALLVEWGYPYVFEEFRFHLTLTERLKEPERSVVMAALEGPTAPLCRTPLRVDSVCLFEQLDLNSTFRVITRYSFGLT